MMNHDERARYILNKLKREKAKRKKRLLRFAALSAGTLAIAGITGILFFASPAFLPSSGDESDLRGSSGENNPTENQSPGDVLSEPASGGEVSPGAASGDNSGETTSGPETSEPEPDFSRGKQLLLSKDDADFEVPLILSGAELDDALKNASGAFEGMVLGFGADITPSAAGPLITLYVEVKDGYDEDFPEGAAFLCPLYFLNFLEEDGEYLFLMFDYASAEKSFGCDRFAVLDAADFTCLVDQTKAESVYPKVVSVSDFRAYFSASRAEALRIYETVRNPGASFTAVLESGDCTVTVVRDDWGEGIFITAGTEETRLYRPAGEDAVYIAEFENTRIRKIAGLDAVWDLTAAAEFLLEKNGVYPDYTRSLTLQHETGFYDFSDGNQIFSLCAAGETKGFDTEGGFTALSEFVPKALESAAAAGEMVNFDLSLENLQKYFGEDDLVPPENPGRDAVYGYEEGMTAFTGLIFAYGEGEGGSGSPPYAPITVWVTNTLYGETEKLQSLTVPAYFTGRLEAEKEYLFIYQKGEIVSPLGILGIDENGALFSPAGFAYGGGTPGLLTSADYMVYYDENHVAAGRIARAFTGLGNGRGDTETFDMAYIPVDLHTGGSEEDAEVRVTYIDGILSLGFYSKQGGFMGYFRESVEEGLFRYGEDGEKYYPKASEYLEKSMIISYIISVTSLKEGAGFLQTHRDIPYETPAGNRLVFGMEEGRLATITLNGTLLARVNYLNFT